MIPHAPWFTESRFGMFVHWGLYALPARQDLAVPVVELFLKPGA